MTTSAPELVVRFKQVAADAPPDAPIEFSVSAPALGLDAGVDGTFVSPLDDRNLADIRWYLEVYPQWPSGPDYDRAQIIEANLPRWGKALWKILFDQGQARDIYRQFEREAGDGRVLTIAAMEPRVLQLPWELLAEEGGFLFAKNPPMSIRRRLPITLAPRPTPTPTLPRATGEGVIRVLMVISRPDDKDVGFLDPRSSAQALLSALDDLGDAVQVDFLRPPTMQALDEALQSQTYHIVHFDGHGVYDRVKGLGSLLFERGDYSLDLVDANRLGTLLNQRNIPLVILDACQTAMQDQREFTSVASKLIEAGVGSVLAMNYSVLVPTTRKFSAAFYHALAQGQSISVATERARRALLDDTFRFTLYRGDKDERVSLFDWFLPALYQQASDPVLFTPSLTLPRSTGEGRVGVPIQPERGGFPDAPPHGFHGRARELLDIERLMLPRQNADGKDKPAHRIVVLHGWGGQGKTALATEAAHWFTRTRLFERAVFVSFEKGGGLELALGEIGNALIGDDFAIHSGDPVQSIEDAVKEKSTLIVWDNLESLISTGNAPLDASAMAELLSAGLRWAKQGQSRLLITTRDPEMPLESFQPSQTTARYELTGLAMADALDLASSILEDTGITPPPRDELVPLLNFLGGHPLSLHLVVPQLRDYAPARLIAEFDKLLPNFSKGAGQGKDESLRVSLEFSLNRLDDATRAMLPQLAVFQGGAWEPMIWRVTDFTEDEWARIRPQLARAALIRIEPLPGVNYPYVHFHPTLAPYLTLTLPSPLKGEEKERYRRAYYDLANQLYSEDDRHPHEARRIVIREMANLRRALALTLDAGELDEAVDFATRITRFLDNFGRWRERDEVMRAVISKQSTVNSGKLTKPEFLLESLKGETLRTQGRAAEAESVFRNLLTRMSFDSAQDAGAENEFGYERVVVSQLLGRCLSAQGKPSAAADAYRAALAAAEKLEQTNNVRRAVGVVHTDLADELSDLGRYDEARREYEAALEISKSVDDERQIAVASGQLGTLALMQADLKEARERYVAALTAFNNLGEERYVAASWHKLGVVAQEMHEFDEAEKCYKETLKISDRLGDTDAAAQACNQLAIVAVSAGRPGDAERWYHRAIEMNEQRGDRTLLAGNYNNLADLLLAQGRLDEAEKFVRRAVAIDETLDLSVEPWKGYNILARIAQARGRAEDARAWRRKERESFAAFAGSEQQIAQWKDEIVAVIAACGGNADARQQVEQLCAQLAQSADWKNLAVAIQRILTGARDYEALADELGLDRVDALIVRKIVEGLQRTG